MNIREYQRYFLISVSLLLFISILVTGCTESQQLVPGLNISYKTPDQPKPTPIPTRVILNEPGTAPVPSASMNDSREDQTTRQVLDKDWKALRVINTDFNEHYLTLDLTKSDDVNYVRYLLVPGTVTRITDIRTELEGIIPVTEDEKNETTTLIRITNYTVLKYNGLSSMLHATQYAAIRDPVQLKDELRNARFIIMDALDIINEKDNAAYPSEYRDQIAADKQELQEMASQVDAYTRSVYLAPQN